MNLKEPINVKAYLEEIDRAFEDRYKSAKEVVEKAKQEILTAIEIQKSLPELSADIFQKAFGFWVRDFSSNSTRPIETKDVTVQFGGYDYKTQLDLRGEIGQRFTTEKKYLVPGDYRAIFIILPSPK